MEENYCGFFLIEAFCKIKWALGGTVLQVVFLVLIEMLIRIDIAIFHGSLN